MDAHRHYAPAAVAIAVAAWRQGTDVYTALQQAGYAWEVAQGLTEWVGSRFFNPEQPPQAQTVSQELLEDVQMAPRVKRARQQAPAAKVAPSVRTYVKKCMERQLEKKFYQKSISGVTPGTGGTFYSIGVPDIVQGTSDSTRVGNQMKILKLQALGLVYDSASGAGNVRILVIQDTQYNGANPAVADIVDNTSTYGQFDNANVIGHGGTRFKILSDKFLSTNYNFASSGHFTHYKLTLNPGAVVTYGASTGANTDVLKNNIYVLALGFSATTTIALNWTITFVDE